MPHNPPPSSHPPLHLYLHIPFCQRICAYCDFARVAAHTHWHAPYINALIAELHHTLPLLPTRAIASLYIGGGSPSFLPASLLTQLLHAVTTAFSLLPSAEISVECNPHQVTTDWAHTLIAAGVNRFSLGVQSLNDHELHILGRLHSAESARRAFSILRAAPCPNISVDLMYGLPDQTEASWHATIHTIADDWQPEHVSLYALQLQHNTPLARLRQRHPANFTWPDDDRIMDWYWHALDYLAARGYQHYELSNTARPGRACRHNIAYWDSRQFYLGLGAAAHSYCTLAPYTAPRRFRNLTSIPAYCARVETGQRWRIFSPPLSARARLGEEIYLALRRTTGFVPRPEHLQLFAHIIRRQLDAGLLLTLPNGALALSRRGIELANAVMSDYV